MAGVADLNGPSPRTGGPSALALARLTPRLIFPPGGPNLYRRLARMVELERGAEFMLAPCGRGVTTQFLAELSGANGSGVDADEALVRDASERARAAGLADRLHYQTASLHDLPYQDSVFDVAIGEIGVAAADDPAAAVRELARVTKPLGTLVLIQIVWTGQPDERWREWVLEEIGVAPRLVMEWKQILRDAGVVELAVEDWSGGPETRDRRPPLGGLGDLLSVRDRLSLVPAAWRRWGWRGLRSLAPWRPEAERVLGRERVLGLSVIRGRKWPAGE